MIEREETRAIVLRALAGVAPELDLTAIDPAASIRDQVDLDSVDFLNFVVALAAATGVEVPEADYPRLATLDGCVEYLTRARAGSGPS
jgi:acyl carrier protein